MKQDPSTLEMIFERLGASNIFGEVGLEASHLFDVEGLDNYLSQTGFKGFAYNVYGPYILFHAEKG